MKEILISRDLYRKRRSAALAEWKADVGQGQAGFGELRPTGDKWTLD